VDVDLPVSDCLPHISNIKGVREVAMISFEATLNLGTLVVGKELGSVPVSSRISTK